MKKIALLLLSFFMMINTFSQGKYCKEDLFPAVGTNKMWGYIDVQKHWKIQPVFDYAYPFTGAMALVKRKGKMGAVNCKGKLIVRCEYDEITPFLGGRAWFRKGEKWGLIKEDATILLPVEFDEIKEIAKYTDQTWVKKSGKWGLYDKYAEKFVWEVQFNEYTQTISSSYAFVKKDLKFGLVSTVASKLLLDYQYQVIEGYKSRIFILQKNDNYGVINYKGKKILAFDFKTITLDDTRLIAQNQRGKYTLYDLWGNKLTKDLYNEMSSFSNGISKVKIGTEEQYITRKGKKIFKEAYTYLNYYPIQNVFVARQEAGSYLMLPNRRKLSVEFDEIQSGGQYFVASKENDLLLLSSLGKQMSGEYAEIKLGDSMSYVRVIPSGNIKTCFYDTKLDKRVSAFYGELAKMDDGYALFKNNTKMGVLDLSYQERITNQDKIDVVSIVGSPFFITNQNGKETVYDSRFKKIIDQDYTKITLAERYFIATDLKAKKTLFNTQGKTLIESGNKNLSYLGLNKFAVSKKGKIYQVLNSKGEVLYKGASFEAIQVIGFNYFPAKRNGKWGYINHKNGKVVVDFIYDTAEPHQKESKKAKVTKDGKVYYLDLRGKVLK